MNEVAQLQSYAFTSRSPCIQCEERLLKCTVVQRDIWKTYFLNNWAGWEFGEVIHHIATLIDKCILATRL